MSESRIAVIVGAGAGLSASVARAAAADGMTPILAARNPEKLNVLEAITGGEARACDASSPDDVASLFEHVTTNHGVPELVVYNPSARVRGPVADLDPEAVQKAIMITAYGGFLVGQAAAKAMLPNGTGTILFTGASASVKGYKNSSCFAMGKFALRGLAQSMARELAPQGVHVGHFIIDGGISESDDPNNPNKLHPDHIAAQYLNMHHQPRSSWTWEQELRPFVETF